MVVKIEAYHDGDSWCARGIGEDIFTQVETLDELAENVREAVELHFEGAALLPDVLLTNQKRGSIVIQSQRFLSGTQPGPSPEIPDRPIRLHDPSETIDR